MNDLVLAAKAHESNQFLTFSVFGKAMAIGIGDVQEIIEVVNVTRVPMSNPCVRGVINLRGNVVPVVDLGCRLYQRQLEIDKRSCIILVEIVAGGESHSLGILAEQVREILEIEPDNIQDSPEFGTEIEPEFIQHMGRHGDDFIIVLNLQRVLSIDELAEISGKAASVLALPSASESSP